MVLLQVGVLLKLKRVFDNTHKESLPASHSLETKVQCHYTFLNPVTHMVTFKVTLEAMLTVDMKMHLKKEKIANVGYSVPRISTFWCQPLHTETLKITNVSYICHFTWVLYHDTL